jgi:hypothetical protein
MVFALDNIEGQKRCTIRAQWASRRRAQRRTSAAKIRRTVDAKTAKMPRLGMKCASLAISSFVATRKPFRTM